MPSPGGSRRTAARSHTSRAIRRRYARGAGPRCPRCPGRRSAAPTDAASSTCWPTNRSSVDVASVAADHGVAPFVEVAPRARGNQPAVVVPDEMDGVVAEHADRPAAPGPARPDEEQIGPMIQSYGARIKGPHRTVTGAEAARSGAGRGEQEGARLPVGRAVGVRDEAQIAQPQLAEDAGTTLRRRGRWPASRRRARRGSAPTRPGRRPRERPSRRPRPPRRSLSAQSTTGRAGWVRCRARTGGCGGSTSRVLRVVTSRCTSRPSQTARRTLSPNSSATCVAPATALSTALSTARYGAPGRSVPTWTTETGRSRATGEKVGGSGVMSALNRMP